MTFITYANMGVQRTVKPSAKQPQTLKSFKKLFSCQKKEIKKNSKFPLYFDEFCFINSEPFLKGRSFEKLFFKTDSCLSYIVTPKYAYCLNKISLLIEY